MYQKYDFTTWKHYFLNGSVSFRISFMQLKRFRSKLD